jgi:hypothetical protein
VTIATLSPAERDLANIVFVLRQVCERLQIPVTFNANANAAVQAAQAGTVAQFVGADGAAANILLDAFGSGPVYATRRADGTCAAPAAVSGADKNLGVFAAYGYGSTGYGGAKAAVQLRSDQAFTDTAQGTYIRFVTCDVGSVTEAESARIWETAGYGVFAFNNSRDIGKYALAGAPTDANTYVNAGTGGQVAFRISNVTVGYSSAAGFNHVGNCIVQSGTAIPAGGTAGAGYTFSTTANFGVFFGSGAPTLSAAKGSLYLRSDGSATNNRAYINTDGGTTWTALTTAA